jgi:hypothetical protein
MRSFFGCSPHVPARSPEHWGDVELTQPGQRFQQTESSASGRAALPEQVLYLSLTMSSPRGKDV